MAKLRQNHQKTRKAPFAGMAIKLFLVIGILTILFVWGFNFMNNPSSSASDGIVVQPSEEMSLFVPEGNQAEVVDHQYYTLGYNEQHEQPDWVTYKLRKSELKIPNVPRAKRFIEDRAVRTRSAKHSDYTRSGYSRGHMAPAGDMAFNETAMQESFFMSNMSPQLIPYNGGVWRELEESVRDWAYKYDELLVASGPIFDDGTKYIGQSSKVRVPSAFYKIIADYKKGSKEGIAFLIPHEVTDQPLGDFAMSIDDLEARIGLDFFDQLYEGADEDDIESSFNMSYWPLSKKRFQNRINNWNNN